MRHDWFDRDRKGPVERKIDRELSKTPQTVSIASLPLGGTFVDHKKRPTRQDIEDLLHITPDS